MPNWCQNNLHIEGPPEDIARFIKSAEGPTQSYNDVSELVGVWPVHDDIRMRARVTMTPEPGEVSVLSFHALYPVPDKVMRFPYDDNTAKKVGKTLGESVLYGGYTWENNHWGCKWGSCDVDIDEQGDDYVQYSFNTPWGAPMGLFDKVAKDWPMLTFSLAFEEPGMGFAGDAEWEAGECSHINEWSIEEEEEDEE